MSKIITLTDYYYLKTEIDEFLAGKASTSHTHGNITTDGSILNQANKNVVTNSNGKIVTEDKPTIPTANSTATNIKMNGTQNAGSLSTFAKADHVHPTDTSRAAASHTHDDRYYTETEIDTKLNSKANSSHTHGNLQNNGQVGSTAQANKNVVTDANGKITTEDKYTHPSGTVKTGEPSSNKTPGFGDTFTVTQFTSNNTGHISGATDRTVKIPDTEASTSTHGLMSANDKSKLDGVATGATKNTVENSLSSTSTTNALSAAQGKALNTAISNKTVTLTKLSTATAGYIATYEIKQGSTSLGKIDIPKDYLVKSGSVKTVSTANSPVSGYAVGDKYIDFVINTKDNSGTDEHIYINVKDLVDVYTHPNSGVTAGTNYNGNQTPAFGATFNIPKLTFNAQGHITASANSTVKIPNNLGNGTTAGLSTNDYTTTEKNKLAGIATGATKNTVSNSLTDTSTTNALSAAQGKALDEKINNITTGNIDLSGTHNHDDRYYTIEDTNGGTNLLTETQDFSNGTSGVITTDTYKGCTVRRYNNTSGTSYVDCEYNTPLVGEFKQGDCFTLSFWAKGTGSIYCYSYGYSGYMTTKPIKSNGQKATNYGDGSCKFTLSNDWKRYYVTWELNPDAGDSSLSVQRKLAIRISKGSDSYLAGVMFERGEVAHDWSPAPSDKASSSHTHPDTQITWNGSVLNDKVSPLDMATYEEFNANRLAYLSANNITVEYSTNGGSTWTDYGSTDAEKVKLVTTSAGFRLGKDSSTDRSKNRLRITIDAKGESGASNVYLHTRKLLIYLGTAGATGTQCRIYKATYANPDTFVDVYGFTNVTGYSGWNSFPIDIIFGHYNTTQNSYIRKLRLEFIQTGGTGNMNINKIRLLGEQQWTVPSTLANTGHLYTYDENQIATFPSNIVASKFIKNGVNNTNLLTANGGDVAQSTFATSGHTHSYLPLSGGTVTGATTFNDKITFSQLRQGSANNDEYNVPWAGDLTWDTDWLTTLKARKSLIGSVSTNSEGWWSVISARHRNGAGDGNAWGMYIKAPLTTNGNLIWQQDLNGASSTEKTILDSSNYSTYANKTTIVNDLTSGGTGSALSAEQGKNLQNNKVDKVSGKGLSTNDFTATYKTALDNLNTTIANAVSNLEMIEVVTSLPTSNIKTNKIYLKANSVNGSENKYDFYVRVNNAWEKIDSLDFSISDYIKKDSNTNLLLSNGTTKAQSTFATSGHTHGFVNNDGTIGGDSDKNKAVITNANGKIATGTIDTSRLSDSAVTSAKIADGTIVNADISSSAAIATSKISGLDTTLNGKENTSNKVTSITPSSTNTQYPSAKAVYDLDVDVKNDFHVVDNNSSTNYYCKFFRVVYSNTYSDTPLNFTIHQRSQPDTHISFNAVWDNTNKIYKSGNLYYDGYPRAVYVHHAAQNTFDFYIYTGTWGNFGISPITTHKTRMGSNITITKTSNMVTELPTSTTDNPVKEATISPYSDISDFVNSTHSSSTSTWTGTSSKIKNLVTGTIIYYKLKQDPTTTDVTLNLTLSGGNTTGAKNVYYDGSRLKNQYKKNQLIPLIYDGTNWIVISPYTDTTYTADNSTLELSGTQFKVKDGGITSAKIADGTIINGDIASNAAIAYSKLSGVCSSTDSRLSDSRVPLFKNIAASSSVTKDLNSNDYKIGGFYYCGANANAPYVNNCPLTGTNNKAFFLLVETWGTSSTYVKQTLTYYHSNDTYIRTCDDGTWKEWRMLENNGNYESPNLLPNTKTFSSPAPSGSSINGEYNGCKVRYLKNTTSDYMDFSWPISQELLKPNTYYTLSFWAKTTTAHQNCIAYFYNSSNQTTLRQWSNSTVSGQNTPVTSAHDGGTTFALTTGWKRYSVTWLLNSTAISAYKSLTIRLSANTSVNPDIYLAGVKFEESKIQTAYSEYSSENPGIECVWSTHASSTSAWTGTCVTTKSIQKGTTIYYSLRQAPTTNNVTLTLTMPNGKTHTGNVYYGATRLTNQYPQYSLIELVWDGSNWNTPNTYTNTVYTHPSQFSSAQIINNSATNASFGGSFTVPIITGIDANGHISAKADRTINMPSLPTANAGTAGIVQVSDSTSTTSSTIAASLTAVKAAYTLANGKPSLGTGANNAAKGNHTHNFTDLNSLPATTVELVALPSGWSGNKLEFVKNYKTVVCSANFVVPAQANGQLTLEVCNIPSGYEPLSSLVNIRATCIHPESASFIPAQLSADKVNNVWKIRVYVRLSNTATPIRTQLTWISE